MNTTTSSTLPENLIGPDRVMDVRDVPCSIKHNLILRNCQELVVDDYFILVNGRDPAHLREDISSAWPGAFAWEYVEQRPDEVRVRITKLKPVKDNVNPSASHDCTH